MSLLSLLRRGPTQAESERLTGSTLALAFGAPAVLVCVALLQLYLSHSHDLSPWKGGGFGMFASVDRIEHRALTVSLEGEQGSLPVDVQAFGAQFYGDQLLLERALSMPTASALDRVAARVADAEWARSPEGHAVPGDGTDPALGGSATAVPEVDVGSVRVEVWRVQYEAEDDVARPDRLASRVDQTEGQR